MDAIQTVKTLLVDNWDASQTDGITPIIDYVFNHKFLRLNSNTDYVLLYSTSGDLFKPAGLGSTHNYMISSPVTIDIRTVNSRSHLLHLRDHIILILCDHLINPDTDYSLIEIGNVKDLSDKSTGLFRMVMEITLKRYNKQFA